MKTIVITLICLIGLSIACSKEGIDKRHLKYEDFKNNLTKEMTYEEIVKTFGAPTEDIGSGIHIYVFKLEDLTEIWIGHHVFVFYARHVDKDGQLLYSIIE